MITYRVSKYDPAKRNELGHYTNLSEWTSISDVLNQADKQATYADYEQVEGAYVAAVSAVMREKEIACLQVSGLELYTTPEDFDGYKKTGRLRNMDIDFEKDLKALRNGMQLSFPQLNKIIRLILRETVWMVLVHNNLEVRFGYDYYMYLKTTTLTPATLQQIQDMGLFAERHED
jgi:hypothetical protein